jgi:hypothetical protein
MNELERSLLALTKDDRVIQAPPEVQAAVMHAWDAMHARVQQQQRIRAAGAALLAIGSLAAVIVAMVMSRAPAGRRETAPIMSMAPAVEPSRVVANAPPANDATPTATPRSRPRQPAARRGLAPRYPAGVVLVADPIVDASAMSIVRVRVPRTALVTLGLPLVEPNDGGSVDLEMLVGEDGVARTIRRAVPVALRQE